MTEQAINSFSEGLLLDSHPMIQGNKTMTDVLNGTIVTMNGNEIILLNDMGNRKVDNANLPEGYEPVGIKEYGGIIYIAAYNPATGKSLLGSFPSPLKTPAYNEGIETSIDFDFTDDKRVIQATLFNGIPLSNGDKFALYSEDFYPKPLSQQLIENPLYRYVANYRNHMYDSIILSVGVYNSLNQFIDITDKLIKDETEQFFIFKSTPTLLSNTIDDEEFLKNRQALKYNTYKEKFTSPLVLQAKLNIPETFSASVIPTYKEEEHKVIFNVITNYTDYNFYVLDGDDWVLLSQSDGVFKVKLGGDELDDNEVKLDSGNIINYKIVPRLQHVPTNSFTSEKTIDLTELTVKGSIDIDKIGSGNIYLTEWRWKKEGDEIMLYFSIQAYPTEESKFANLYLTFTEEGSVGNKIVIKRDLPSIISGNFKQPLLSVEGISSRKVYYVDIATDNGEDKDGVVIKKNISADELWVLTTGLLDDCFGDVNNFCEEYKTAKKLKNLHILPTHLGKKRITPPVSKFLNKFKITPTVEAQIELTPQPSYKSKAAEVWSKEVPRSGYNSELGTGFYEERRDNIYDYEITFIPKIKDEELYPDSLILNGQVNILNSNSTCEEPEYESTINVPKPTNVYTFHDNGGDTEKVTGLIRFQQVYRNYPDKAYNIKIENVLIPYSEVFMDLLQQIRSPWIAAYSYGIYKNLTTENITMPHSEDILLKFIGEAADIEFYRITPIKNGDSIENYATGLIDFEGNSDYLILIDNLKLFTSPIIGAVLKPTNSEHIFYMKKRDGYDEKIHEYERIDMFWIKFGDNLYALINPYPYGVISNVLRYDRETLETLLLGLHPKFKHIYYNFKHGNTDYISEGYFKSNKLIYTKNKTIKCVLNFDYSLTSSELKYNYEENINPVLSFTLVSDNYQDTSTKEIELLLSEEFEKDIEKYNLYQNIPAVIKKKSYNSGHYDIEYIGSINLIPIDEEYIYDLTHVVDEGVDGYFSEGFRHGDMQYYGTEKIYVSDNQQLNKNLNIYIPNNLLDLLKQDESANFSLLIPKTIRSRIDTYISYYNRPII